MIYANQEELEAGLAKWQKILRLQDWNIITGIKRAKDMHERDNRGEAWPWNEHKRARIYLVDHVDHEDPDWGDLDHERILVHELLHLHVNRIMDEVSDVDKKLADRLHTQEEECVNLIADALIALDRKAP